MSRDDETEPMTKILGTFEHTERKDDPHRRLAHGEQTRLEIARPKLAAAEPATKIVDPSTFRRLSLDVTLPSTPRTRPLDEITAPRLSISPHDEITAPRRERRVMPFALAVLLAMVCLATGASLLRPRDRDPKPAAARPAATQPAQAPASRASAPFVTANHAAPATQPVEAPPEPSAPVEPAVVAELEKRAVDRLRDNDHPGALALYRELTRVDARQPAYPVMVSLLERRVRACPGEPGCAREQR